MLYYNLFVLYENLRGGSCQLIHKTERRKTVNDNQILEHVSGTFFGEVLALMEGGNILDVNDKEVAEGEKIVGELTLFERAFIACVDKAVDVFNKEVETVKGNLPPNIRGRKKFLQQLVELKWLMVMENHGLWGQNVNTLSIRKGGKIVAYDSSSEEHDDCSTCKVRDVCPIRGLMGICVGE